jgi:hypothetical protein
MGARSPKVAAGCVAAAAGFGALALLRPLDVGVTFAATTDRITANLESMPYAEASSAIIWSCCSMPNPSMSDATSSFTCAAESIVSCE